MGAGAGGVGGTGGTFGGVGLVGSGAVFDVDPSSAVVGTFDTVLIELAFELWRHRCDGLSFQVLSKGRSNRSTQRRSMRFQ